VTIQPATTAALPTPDSHGRLTLMSLATVETVMKSLADKNRLRIIALLSTQKMCVCELATILGITQPSVSKHLKKMKQAGILVSEQNGLWTDYVLCADELITASVLKQLITRMKDDPTLKADRLKAKKIDRNDICCH
jgi:ArsR family transcriptional regulator